MALTDSVDEVAARENESAITAIPTEEMERQIESLHRTHLPKVGNANFVRHDGEGERVTPSEDTTQRAVLTAGHGRVA